VKSDTENKTSTSERILQATLSIIGNEGFQKITIKKIAELAEVNIAAVNYHFGSKDNVINEAMKILTRKLMKCFEMLDDKEILPKERMRKFLLKYSDTALEYPDVFRNFISDTINNNDKTFEYIEFLKYEGIEMIKATLIEAGIKENEDILSMKTFQMLSTLEIPILLGNKMKYLSGIDYSMKDVRSKYIEVTIKWLFND
jgi:TetR/AcrR family transcriptional regulator, regulator of cefoperazone and chloramphenicol sensitivity